MSPSGGVRVPLLWQSSGVKNVAYYAQKMRIFKSISPRQECDLDATESIFMRNNYALSICAEFAHNLL